jgi:hypothetical protein
VDGLNLEDVVPVESDYLVRHGWGVVEEPHQRRGIDIDVAGEEDSQLCRVDAVDSLLVHPLIEAVEVNVDVRVLSLLIAILLELCACLPAELAEGDGVYPPMLVSLARWLRTCVWHHDEVSLYLWQWVLNLHNGGDPVQLVCTALLFEALEYEAVDPVTQFCGPVSRQLLASGCNVTHPGQFQDIEVFFPLITSRDCWRVGLRATLSGSLCNALEFALASRSGGLLRLAGCSATFLRNACGLGLVSGIALPWLLSGCGRSLCGLAWTARVSRRSQRSPSGWKLLTP